MPTLFPRGVTREEIGKALLEDSTDKDRCDNNAPALACLAASFAKEAHEIIENGHDPMNGLMTMLMIALSTGIEVVRGAPEWSLVAQAELEDWFHEKGLVNGPPSSHDVHREMIQHFAQRHPMEATNEKQDLVLEKTQNECQSVEI